MSRPVSEYEEDVNNPGKFEREARYVPYFYDAYMDGGADNDDGRVLTFYVSDEDKKLFPELKGRKAIKLVEDDYGFVSEVSPPQRSYKVSKPKVAKSTKRKSGRKSGSVNSGLGTMR